jgi:threonine synthase
LLVPDIICADCGYERSIDKLEFICPICGGVFDYAAQFEVSFESKDPSQPGIWSYREAFDLPDEVAPISLGEGNTPLIWDSVRGRQVAFKLDYLNPTGSYKDRGTTILISYLAWQGVETAVEDSSGNAGASFAAYASRAGIQGRVYVPEAASGPKRAQIEAYGVDLICVPGPRSSAAEAVKIEAEQGAVYASHIYQPFVFLGYATAAYEIVEQLGESPGAVITPVGQGSLLLGMSYGFQSLLEAGLISELPQMVGVQAKACAPLWALAIHGKLGADSIHEGETIAEGIRIRYPLRGEKVLEAVKNSQGSLAAVDEKEIIPARDELAARGFYVEPTSAVVWPALLDLMDELHDPIVVILTGSGLKFDPT